MSQWKKIAPFAALSLSMALTATGCFAPEGDQLTDEQATATTADPQNDDAVGEAHQACFGGFGAFRGLTASLFVDGIFPFLPGPFPFFLGGCGFPFFGGCGGCF